MRCTFTSVILLLLASSLALAAPDSPPPSPERFDWDLAGQIAVQAGGRVKPLDSYARELVKSIHGRSSYAHQHPVESYFHWMSDGEKWAGEPLVYLPKNDLRKRLGLHEEKGNHFSLLSLRSRSELMSLVMEAQSREEEGEKLTFTQTKARDLLFRMGALSDVFIHEAPLFVPTADPEVAWFSMPEVITRLEDSTSILPEDEHLIALGFMAMYNAVGDERSDIFNSGAHVIIEAQRTMLVNQERLLSKLDWEYRLNRLNPFLWAKVLLIHGFVFFFASLRSAWSRWKKVAFIQLLGGWAIYTFGMALRMYIAGRAPWSNMYESLLAIGWALVLLAVIFEAIRRDRLFGAAGTLLGTIVLGLAQFASLDRGINPLVPALQSYWLNYHVIVTLAAYACFALAMAVGHVVLISGVRSKGQVTSAIAQLTRANLRIIQIGSLFLIAGILLGAVWANVSWGRFWGWDPKETWALICWFVYIILLHGRSAGWLAWRGLAVASVAVFPVVVMTYYGVNYYLSGLHSYGAGSSPGIPWQVFAYLGAEALFLAWALWKLRGTGRPHPAAAIESEEASALTTEVAS